VVICCKVCSKEQSLVSQAHWKRHYLTHVSADERPHKCEHCGKTFVQLSSMKSHVKNIHEKNNQEQKIEVKNEFYQ